MNLQPVKEMDLSEVKQAILNSSRQSSIYVGCDSLTSRKGVRFALVVVIHLNSNQGGKIYHSTYFLNSKIDLKTRLLKEVEMVTNLALQLVDVIGNRSFQVHLDINGDKAHKSSIVVKEAVGWVTGLGFDCVIKPDAFCASYAADHAVRM
jgi:predicted RNase H-related nuclease YkuK (DUF458 family)